MKNFNISKQNKNWAQAYKKKYINQLWNQTNSLYEYLHYYNPEWRVLGWDTKGEKNLSYFIYDNSYVYESSLITERPKSNEEEAETITCVDLWKLHFRWGFKNRFSHEVYYGKNGYESEALSVGATIYKKDSYDLDYLKGNNYNREEFLSHFIVFEAALAQYITWTISTGIDTDGNAALIYTYHLSNELDFGLQYNIQVVESTPRYFYDGTYKIKYINNNFDTTTLLDYINTNVQYSNDSSDTQSLEPPHSGTDYQHWCGATNIFPQTVYVNNDEYEELIAETVLYERPGKTSEYQVRFNKQSTNHPQIEDKFEVIFS